MPTLLALLVLPALLTAAAATAAGQSSGERGDNSAFGIAPLPQDFVTLTTQAEMVEVQSSQLALMRAGNDKTKAFARRAIKARDTANELKALVSNGQVRAIEPLFLGKVNAEQIDRLWNLEGAEFTQAYKDLQVSLHKEAVSLFERYAREGESLEVKAFANRHLPGLRQQLEEAEELEK